MAFINEFIFAPEFQIIFAIFVMAVFFGIVRDKGRCSKCGEKIQRLQLPSSLREWFLGGYHCNHCGEKIDGKLKRQ